MSASRHLLRAAQRTRSTILTNVLRSNLSASTTLHVRHLNTPAYPEHIPLNWAENAFMAVGSAIMSLADPRRGDMIAALGETTASNALLNTLREQMLSSPEGRRILKERPRIKSDTIDLEKLALLPEGTFGRTYVTWLDRCGVTPDTREPVHYIDDPELAYTMQRYRECHDFYHALFSLPVSVESEIALKWFEYVHFGLPMAALGAIFGPLRLDANKRARLFREYVPWAMRCGASAKPLIAVYWEERWEMTTEELKKELGVWDPPAAIWGKALSEKQREQRRREAEQRREQTVEGLSSGGSGGSSSNPTTP